MANRESVSDVGVDFVTDGFGRDASDQLVAMPVRPSEERLACDIGERPVESTVHLRRTGLHVNDEHDGLLTPLLTRRTTDYQLDESGGGL